MGDILGDIFYPFWVLAGFQKNTGEFLWSGYLLMLSFQNGLLVEIN